MNNTPLRYPGGKSIMTPFLTDMISENDIKSAIYVEPYSGGAGAAINLLLNDVVAKIMINDASLGVYSFWYYLVHEGEEFLALFDKAKVTLGEWKIQREIFKNSTVPSLELGFATFFLSRCNRSGILHAGPIGGQDQEKQDAASYKIDCRFNKKRLRERLERIIERKDSIDVSNDDALVFMDRIESSKESAKMLVYLDPPYYTQGKSLYLNHYKHEDHSLLSDLLSKTKNIRWILSYDDVEPIRELYSDFDLYGFNLNYSAQRIKKGAELLTHSENTKLPKSLVIRRPVGDIPVLPLL